MIEQKTSGKHTQYILKYMPGDAKNNKTMGAAIECLYNCGKLGYHFNAINYMEGVRGMKRKNPHRKEDGPCHRQILSWMEFLMRGKYC